MKRLLCVLSIIALPIIANGDTIRLTNNSSLNGAVRYENGIFYVQADYKGGPKNYAFPRDEVRADEINNETYNQGAPPPDIRAHQVDYEKWYAVNTPGDLAIRRTEATRNSNIVGTAVGNRRRDVQSGSLSGRDTLTLKNQPEQTGTLMLMTASTIIFRPNGGRKDVHYDRDAVRTVTVKKSG